MAQAADRHIPARAGSLPEAKPRDAALIRFERSALLHPRAADALVLAATPYPGRPMRRPSVRRRRVLRGLGRRFLD
jgi:hypothetical protein